MAAFLEFDASCPDCASNAALEMLCKSLAENPRGDDAGLWAPHPNPLLRPHVEDCAGRLRDALQALLDAFGRALTGESPGALAKALPGTEPDPEALARIIADLESRDPSTYSLDDWLRLVDALIARTLPPDRIDGEAERMVLRADLLGRAQALIPRHQKISVAALAHLSHLVPTEFARVPPRLLSPVEIATLETARARAALAITDVTETARAAMKRAVVEHTQAMILGQREGGSERMRQALFDRFADSNKDLRRVAVTEITDAFGQGVIASLPPGTRVRRREPYPDACPFCKSIDRLVLTVISPDARDKDGWKSVWAGKSNVGRSASPRKKVGGMFVERPADEKWYPAAGAQHPWCRGWWERVASAPPEVSPAFAAWLDGLLAEAAGRDARPEASTTAP